MRATHSPAQPAVLPEAAAAAALASGEASVSGGGRYPASAAWLQHDLVHYALAILVLFAAWRPSLRTLCASHLAVCALRLARVPHLFDGEYWALST